MHIDIYRYRYTYMYICVLLSKTLSITAKEIPRNTHTM